MTDITWEQAREKVRERHGDAYCKDVCGYFNIWDGVGGVFLGGGVTEELAWLNAYTRIKETSPSPERIAAVTELPSHKKEEISVLLTPDPWEDNGYWHLTYASGITGVYHSRDAALEAVNKYVASQAAEMAALRSAKEKAEATARVGKQVYAEYRDEMSAANAREYDRAEAAEAENTRLRDALGLISQHVAFHSDVYRMARAALSTPATKKEG